ncbi:DNA-binding protein [Microbacteriaceae bacterium VKM Ac-2854]|nr:DNA-binding protein [Microbacteriaceae bacterium VKM Ac-2854]
MYVITADQRDSRHDEDRVDAVIADITRTWPDALLLPPERTAGDEFQLLPDSAEVAVDLVLHLHRTQHWSIGLGVGAVEHPLPKTTRAARGPAFFAARRAVEAAKNRPSRFAVDPDASLTLDFPSVRDLEALADPLLHLRDQRTEAGWQVVDLLRDGVTQSDVADRLRVTPQAISLRARSANARADEPARAALIRLLAAVDRVGPEGTEE